MTLLTVKVFKRKENHSRVTCTAEFPERMASAKLWAESRLKRPLLGVGAMLAMLNKSKWRRPLAGQMGSV